MMVRSCPIEDVGKSIQIVLYCQCIHKLELPQVHRRTKDLNWTKNGPIRALNNFDKVKADCKANPGFVIAWIAKKYVQLQEHIKNLEV